MIWSSKYRPAAHRRRAGFTLAEVVFAAAIMGGALALFMTSFTFAAKCVCNARNQMVAMNYAREQLEERRGLGFLDLQLNPGTYVVTDELYRATIVVSSISSNEKRVAVSVPWTNYTLRANSTARYDTAITMSIH